MRTLIFFSLSQNLVGYRFRVRSASSQLRHHLRLPLQWQNRRLPTKPGAQSRYPHKVLVMSGTNQAYLNCVKSETDCPAPAAYMSSLSSRPGSCRDKSGWRPLSSFNALLLSQLLPRPGSPSRYSVEICWSHGTQQTSKPMCQATTSVIFWTMERCRVSV